MNRIPRNKSISSIYLLPLLCAITFSATKAATKTRDGKKYPLTTDIANSLCTSTTDFEAVTTPLLMRGTDYI